METIAQRSNLDKYVAYFGIIFSILLILFSIFILQKSIFALPGIFTLVACRIWLSRRRIPAQPLRYLAVPKRESPALFSILLVYIFFIFFLLSILLIVTRNELYQRPILFFVLYAIMVCYIFVEILYVPQKFIAVILFQIILMGILLAWSQLLLFPSIVGFDPWTHADFTNLIIENGTIPLGWGYSFLPIFHIFGAIMAILLSVPYKIATMLSVSVSQIICNVLFLFLLGKALFNDHRIGLLASLIVINGNQHIFMSYWSIPNGFAAIFIPIILYLLIFINKQYRSKHLFLVIGFMMVVLLTHSITAFWLLLVLLAVWGIYALIAIGREEGEGFLLPYPLALVLLFCVAMFSYWKFVSGHLWVLSDLIRTGFSFETFIQSPSIVAKYISTVPLLEQIGNNLGFFLYFALSLLGIFYIMRELSKSDRNAYIAAGIIPLLFGFLPLLTGQSLIEHRWWYFSQIILAITTAIALILFLTWKENRFFSSRLFVFFLLFVFSFFSITSTAANIDNHFYNSDIGVRPAFIESELASFSTLDQIAGSVEIKGDRIMLLINSYLTNARFIPMDEELLTGNFSISSDSRFAIRSEIISHPLLLYDSVYKLDYNLEETLNQLKVHQIYNSKTLRFFVGG